MKAIEGKIGRIFLMRLDYGDPLPQCIETFASEKGIRLAHVVFLGGVYKGSLVSGPQKTEDPKPVPIVLPIHEANEAIATGMIVPDGDGRPVLHMHGSLGRSGQAATGCFQKGVTVWLVGEAVLYEILSDASPARILDKESGLKLLEIPEAILTSGE
jgi:predicted DNA-binding protein with PD1-like motif